MADTNAFGVSTSAPQQQAQPQSEHQTWVEIPVDQESYGPPPSNEGWTQPQQKQRRSPQPAQPNGAAHSIPARQPQQQQPSPLAQNFGDGLSGGLQSLATAVRDGIVGQTPYQLPLVGRGKNPWEAGFDTFQGWIGGSVAGGFVGIVWILAAPNNRSGALNFSLTGLGVFLAVFAFTNFPLTQSVRRIPMLGWVLGHQRGFLFYLSFLVNLASMAVGQGPLWWLYSLVAERIA